MANHLSDKDIETAVKLLDGWQDKLTWSSFLETFRQATGKSISRQGVHKNHPRIVAAYNEGRNRHRSARQSQRTLSRITKTGDAVATLMAEKIERLKNENKTLKRENHALLEQFLRWQYNANSHGMTEEMLNRPLPSTEQGKGSTGNRGRKSSLRASQLSIETGADK